MASSDVTITANGATPAAGPMAPAEAAPEGRAIFHPVVDFLCLGGASLFLLPLALMLPESSMPTVAVVMLVVTNVLNHPHFAASYQIFYRDFREKAFGETLPPQLRARYIIAGLVVPVALFVFIAAGFLLNDRQMLGWSGNIMLFFVGWHYAKQGYGMLIVDSVYRRRFFSNSEKSVFLYNAYACWASAWLFANWLISERHMWGLSYYSFDIPEWALFISLTATLATTILTFGIFVRRLGRNGGGLPVAGVTAYLITLYVWFVGRYAPATLFVIPALHSLQYLVIVGRYEKNRLEALAKETEKPRRSVGESLFRFGGTAFLLGFVGFWLVPVALNKYAPYDDAVLGGTVFLFMFWIFINIHHYFIDSVIWRRDNPDTSAYLFGTKPSGS